MLRVSRNGYALPTARKARLAAAILNGVASHLSAAAHWGWALKLHPERPHVTVPRGRNISREAQAEYDVHWALLGPSDVDGWFTSRVRTVLDCARSLPFDEALTVADSALRAGLVRADLEQGAAELRGPGSSRARAVVAAADGRAENPFESVLRALAIQAGLDVVPQAPIDTTLGTLHPDLVSSITSLVVEADSWTHHANRVDHDRDCARYNALVVAGWTVLRFTYEQVMHDAEYVVATIRAVMSGPHGRPQPQGPFTCSA